MQGIEIRIWMGDLPGGFSPRIEPLCYLNRPPDGALDTPPFAFLHFKYDTPPVSRTRSCETFLETPRIVDSAIKNNSINFEREDDSNCSVRTAVSITFPFFFFFSKPRRQSALKHNTTI